MSKSQVSSLNAQVSIPHASRLTPGAYPNAAQQAAFLPGLFAPIEPSTRSLVQWTAEEYVERKTDEGMRPGTIDAYVRDVAFFDAFFRARYATFGRGVTFADLCDGLRDEFYSWRRRSDRVHSAKTAERSVRHLEAVWRDAANRRPPLCLPPGPRAKIKHDPRAPDAWWPDELAKLRSAVRGCDWTWRRPRRGAAARGWIEPPFSPAAFLEAVVELVLNTAARKDAVLTTPTANFDLARGVILIPSERQKHRRGQAVRLKPETASLWSALDLAGRGVRTLGGDWPYDRHPNSRWKTLDGWLARLVRDAELIAPDEPVRRHLWHKLRRTAATYVARKKGISAAQRLLGHVSPTITVEHYIDQRMLDDVDISDCLPDFDPPPLDVIPLRRAE